MDFSKESTTQATAEELAVFKGIVAQVMHHCQTGGQFGPMAAALTSSLSFMVLGLDKDGREEFLTRLVSDIRDAVAFMETKGL